MNETEKNSAGHLRIFGHIFLTCEECCKTTGRICECIRYAARIWNTKDTARKGVESGNINEFFLVLTK